MEEQGGRLRAPGTIMLRGKQTSYSGELRGGGRVEHTLTLFHLGASTKEVRETSAQPTHCPEAHLKPGSILLHFSFHRSLTTQK